MPGNCLLVISKNEGKNTISVAEQAMDSDVIDKVIISDGSNEDTFNRLKKGETKNIEVIAGWAKCLECEMEYPVYHAYDGCPDCKSYFKDILRGKELRVKSLEVS